MIKPDQDTEAFRMGQLTPILIACLLWTIDLTSMNRTAQGASCPARDMTCDSLNSGSLQKHSFPSSAGDLQPHIGDLNKWELHSAAALHAARHSLGELHVPHALLKCSATDAALLSDGGHEVLLNLRAT